MLLGKTWGCGMSLFKTLYCNSINLYVVVLLDEADVFLEQRKISDLQRNALVSGQ
jgi:hypothetical protein